jgi:hypothetical protein
VAELAGQEGRPGAAHDSSQGRSFQCSA